MSKLNLLIKTAYQLNNKAGSQEYEPCLLMSPNLGILLFDRKLYKRYFRNTLLNYNLTLKQIKIYFRLSGAAIDRSCTLEIDPKIFILEQRLSNFSDLGVSTFDDSHVKQKLVIPNGKNVRIRCSDSKSTLRYFDVTSLGMECKRGQFFNSVSLT
jgi:hypothetical protein